MPKDWDAFYRNAPEDRPPAFVVRAYGPFVPQGPVLDLAGGLGRNARYFLQRGHPVVLVERSREALRRLSGTPGLTLVALDLEGADAPQSLPQGPFAGIVMAYYVNRPLLQGLAPLLLPGVGAQGGRPLKGEGLLFAASRALYYPGGRPDLKAALEAAEALLKALVE